MVCGGPKSRPLGFHRLSCRARVRAIASNSTDASSSHTSMCAPALQAGSAEPSALTAPRGAVEVKLQRSKRTIAVAADCSIADALGAHGIDVPTSCREGVCGTCLTGVIAGTPDHRDAFLSQKERKAGDKMMICVSRAKSGQLVLDL